MAGLAWMVWCYYLEAVVREKELDKLILVRNSPGGHVALLYTLRNPGKVDRLVLTGSSGLMENTFGRYTTMQSKRKLLPLIGLARAARKQNLSDVLHRIHVPTLLVWGLQDEITPLRTAYEFYAKISGSRIRLINNCGHTPMTEQPKLFNFYLKEFLHEGEASKKCDARQQYHTPGSFSDVMVGSCNVAP